MKYFNIFEKLNILINIFLSSTFSIIAVLLAIILIVLMVVDVNRKKKLDKKIYIIGWSITAIITIIKFSELFLGLADNFVSELFIAFYFPNYAVYTCLIAVINGVVIYTILKDKLKKSYKIINLITTVLIDLLFVFILDIITKEGISIYETLDVYSNKDLMVLMELSTGIFTIWALIDLGIYIVDKSTDSAENGMIKDVAVALNHVLVVKTTPVMDKPKARYKTDIVQNNVNKNITISPINTNNTKINK